MTEDEYAGKVVARAEEEHAKRLTEIMWSRMGDEELAKRLVKKCGGLPRLVRLRPVMASTQYGMGLIISEGGGIIYRNDEMDHQRRKAVAKRINEIRGIEL